MRAPGRRLASGGRIAVNIARDWAQDTTLVRIADRLLNEDLDAKIFEEAAHHFAKRTATLALQIARAETYIVPWAFAYLSSHTRCAFS